MNDIPAPSPKRFLRWAMRVLAALGLLLVLVTVTPLVYWVGTALGSGDTEPANQPGDVLIVLSASRMSDDGILAQDSYLRALYALRVYRHGGIQQILVSGDGRRAPVAMAIRDFLQSNGVPGNLIQVETASRNTRENALYTARLLASVPGRKVLLTSDYHMFRACRAFAKAGLQVFPHPIPDVEKRASRWRGRWPAFVDLVGEAVRIGYYFVRGWI